MTDFFRDWGWIIAIVVQLFVALLIAAMRSNFATKAEIVKANDQAVEHSRRLDILDTKLAARPDHDDLEKIHRRIGELKDSVIGVREGVGELKGTVDGLKRGVELLNRTHLEGGK